MIRLISNDGKPVEFPKHLAREIPYARDAVTNLETFEGTLDLPIPFANEAQLLVLKRILIAKVALTASYIPRFGGFQIGNTVLSRPPFSHLVWDSYLNSIFHSLLEYQIEDLLIIAQATCMWELRTGALYLMIHRLLKGRNTFSKFFEEDPHELTKVLVEIYKTAFTSVDHSDCCVLPYNTHWE